MKAIAISSGTSGVSLIDVQEPLILASDDIKVRILQVGICGTDREEVTGGRANPPAGKHKLVIGHEMFGQVVDMGSAVTKIKKDDYGVFLVRRGCAECEACKHGRSDMCFSGNYTERGIKEADGFQAEYVVDKEQFFVKVPTSMKSIGVLTEPMSVASKAIEESIIIQQARLKEFSNGNGFQGKKALIAGIGTIGLMAAFALRLRGAEVIGMDIVDENTLRPQILKKIGGRYVDGRQVKATDLDDVIGEADFIFEATGMAKLQLQLIDALGVNGIYVVTGIPEGNREDSLATSGLLRQLVLKNQLVLGSVNAGLQHYKIAVHDLEACLTQWPEEIKAIITETIPYHDFQKAFDHHSVDEIKVVVEWDV